MRRNIVVSWRGSQGSFAKCSSPLLKFFVETSVSWRKKGTQFPCHVLIPLKFAPFNKTLILPQQSNQKDTETPLLRKTALDCALVHLYFLESADLEEYRGSGRPDLVEWFAQLRDESCRDWIIVFDSSRAREVKARAAVLEKLRNDFSKYVTKIVEVDSSNPKLPGLVKCLREQVVLSMDNLVVGLEKYLQFEKERCYDEKWDVFNYVDSQFALSQLYSTLGLHEQVLAQYDELNALLSMILWKVPRLKEATKISRAAWIKTISTKIPLRCPSLILSAKSGSEALAGLSEGTLSLLELRVLLLSRQIVSIFDHYNVKVQSVLAATLQSSFMVLILQHALATVSAYDEESRILQINLPRPSLFCWEILFCLEIFQFCAKLGDPAQIDSCGVFLCPLWLKLCAAMQRLGVVCGLMPETSKGSGDVENEQLVSMNSQAEAWLNQDDEVGKRLVSMSKVRAIISNCDAFGTSFQKFHEDGMAVMKHFQWKRHAKMLGQQLADFLVLKGEVETAQGYYRKHLNSLLKEGWIFAFISLLEEVIPHFEGATPAPKNELLKYSVWLSSEGHSPEVREKYGKRFSELSEEADMTLKLSPFSNCFSLNGLVEISSTKTFPGSPVRCKLPFSSQFPLPLQATVKICFSHSSGKRTTGGIHTRSSAPVFVSDITEKSARLTCLNTSRSLEPRSSVGDVLTPPENCSTQFQSSLTIAPDSESLIEFNLELSESGEYRTEHIHVCVNRVMIEVPIPPDLQNFISCSIMKPTISFTPVTEPVLGGIAQDGEIAIRAGTSGSPQPTSLSLAANDTDCLLFWDDGEEKWIPNTSIIVPQLQPLELKTVHFQYMIQLKNSRSDAVQSFGISMEWEEGSTWEERISVQPTLTVTPIVRLVEDRALLELRLRRCAGTHSIHFETSSLTNEEGARIEGPLLLNPSYPVMPPKSVHTLIWDLCDAGKVDSIVAHLTYRTSSEAQTGPVNCRMIDYIYQDFTQADYEVCCQITSRPVLCRAETPCDLVISIRSLKRERRSEILHVELEASLEQWKFPEPKKSIPVKESGLGQATFPVMPRCVGYLPLPSVRLKEEGSKGTLLKSYTRTGGKQVHVLAPFSVSNPGKTAKSDLLHIPLDV